MGLLSVFLGLSIFVAGCHSDGKDAAAPPAAIGSAGGTVNGTGGSSIVVPANALAANTNIAIAQSSSGAPALPADLEPAGDMFAITPHGTAFAVAATITIPFDPADVPAGRTVQLMKTNAAQNGWETVAGATISGNTLSAQTSSLSWWLAALVAAAPTITTEPADVAVNVGQSANFEVVAEANGAALSFQWKLNGNDIPGATAANYTIASTSIDDNNDRYTVVVKNNVGTALSREAVLTVNTSSAAGWATLGTTVFAGGPVRLGGLAVSPNGRVGVAYVAGSSGTAGLVGELRVSEWDGATWSQVGGALNITTNDGVSLSVRSLAYDDLSRPVVAWLDRFTLTLVVQRWNGSAWERLGNPLFPGGAATSDPQIVIDPVIDQPIVVISSGPFVTVREWSESTSTWTPTVFNQNLISLFGASLSVSRSGQRLLRIAYGENTAGSLLLARLYAPNAMGEYVSEVGGPISATSFSASNFKLDLDNDGTNPFALIGDTRNGPLLVRRLSGSAWEGVGGDLGIPNGASAQLRVTPFGLPLVGYMPDSSPRSVKGMWWDGSIWQSVASATATTVDVIQFALGLAPNGLPYVALTQRDPASSSQLASELVVRRLVPVALSVVVNGPANSGGVSAGAQSCPVGATCDVPVPAGTSVVLQAVPATVFSLQSWVGCDSVVAQLCTVTVNQSRTVTATFQ